MHNLDIDIRSYDRWNDPWPSVMAYKSFSFILSWNKKKKNEEENSQCYTMEDSMKKLV